jgi:hypothetical protein
MIKAFSFVEIIVDVGRLKTESTHPVRKHALKPIPLW